MLSIFPGIGYVFLGWLADNLWPAMVWYGLNIGVSSWGIYLYRRFDQKNMGHRDLQRWDRQVVAFIYMFFALWALIFAIYVQKTAYGLHYIAIFTQIGATTVAASFLYPVPRLFKVIIPLMIGMLAIYFFSIHEWYGYILSIFSLILGWVLYHAANSTYQLLQTTQRQATHDLLTDLHNRQYFVEKLQRQMVDLRNIGGNSYLLLIDLDHFKTVNDSLGHDIGDGLLQEVASRMQACLPGNCALARLGGDEFIVIGRVHRDAAKCEERAMRLAFSLLAALKQTYIVDEHHIYISASIGVRLFSAQDTNPTNLVREADIAMYEVKAGGRDGVFLFNEEISHRVEQHLQIERLLHFALERKEISMRYQPLMDGQKNIIGVECLARWKNDLLGEISPARFIPIAEQTGLIVDLGLYILKVAFDQLREWDDKGIAIQQFSINISIRQLMHFQFADSVKYLCESRLSPELVSKLMFEITETVVRDEVRKVVTTMQSLQDIGIQFSMDDFGTGYSSLSYLKQLPVTELKIDKSFVRHLDRNEENRGMVTTILSIAKFMDLEVVAEGIENEEEYRSLQQLGCNKFQGYFFHKPLLPEQLEACYDK